MYKGESMQHEERETGHARQRKTKQKSEKEMRKRNIQENQST